MFINILYRALCRLCSRRRFWNSIFSRTSFFLGLFIRNRPFNLKGGGGGVWFFVSFIIFFSNNTRVRIFIFFVAQSAKFFPGIQHYAIWQKLWIRLFLFSSTKIRIFFSATLGIRIFFLEKKNITPPPPFKLNGRSLRWVQSNIICNLSSLDKVLYCILWFCCSINCNSAMIGLRIDDNAGQFSMKWAGVSASESHSKQVESMV